MTQNYWYFVYRRIQGRTHTLIPKTLILQGYNNYEIDVSYKEITFKYSPQIDHSNVPFLQCIEHLCALHSPL